MFGNFNKGKRGRVEENTELRELDEFGNPKQTQAEKRAATPSKMQSSNGGSRMGGGKLGIGAGLVFLLLIILYFTGNLEDVIDMFSATPEENLGAMLGGIRDVEKANHLEGKLHAVYDHKSLYDASSIFTQVEKEYIVYLFTGDETIDSAFNDWVLANKKDIPIYTFSVWSNTDVELDAVVGNNPTFLVVFEKEKGYKVLDSKVTDATAFDQLPATLNAIREYRQAERSNK